MHRRFFFTPGTPINKAKLFTNYHNRAAIYERQGKREAAIAEYRTAQRYQPQYEPSQQALERLSEPNRLTVILFYFQSHSLQEIAEFLEVPLTTVKSRLRNARAQLRKEWIRMTEETFDAQKPSPDFTRQVMSFFDAVRANDVAGVRRLRVSR